MLFIKRISVLEYIDGNTDLSQWMQSMERAKTSFQTYTKLMPREVTGRQYHSLRSPDDYILSKIATHELCNQEIIITNDGELKKGTAFDNALVAYLVQQLVATADLFELTFSKTTSGQISFCADHTTDPYMRSLTGGTRLF